MKNNKITKIEEPLEKLNSKTCDYYKFMNYVKVKNDISEKLLNLYENKIFRQLRWYGYINRKREDANLVKKIKEIFMVNPKGNEKLSIIMGDWGVTKQMRNFISTPNKHIKRVLSEQFNIYDFDEFRIECIC